jgi:hypothetical protein
MQSGANASRLEVKQRLIKDGISPSQAHKLSLNYSSYRDAKEASLGGAW